jgi:RNA polymerase sigma factor (sigma-70 family)
MQTPRPQVQSGSDQAHRIEECDVALTTTVKSAPPRAAGVAGARPTDNTRLMHRAAAGDEAAWNDLIDRFSGLVWSIPRSLGLGAADAADVFQTTWLRLVEHVGALAEPEHVAAWLATTARRECLRLLRGAQRQIPVGDALPERIAETPEPHARLVAAERDATLRLAFARLRPADQALLRLLVTDPTPSYNEVSVALDMPIGSIGPTRARCIARLAREHELASRPSRWASPADGPGSATRGSSLAPASVASLSPASVASLPPAPVASLPPAPVASLPPAPVASLPPAPVASLPPAPVASLPRGSVAVGARLRSR